MKHIHLIGIGGTGLSAIAQVLLDKGHIVSGSDRAASPLFKAITAAGAKTFLGHAAENIVGADMVIRSSAVPDDNPEVVAALANGIPVLKRSSFLAELTEGKQTLAVAGSHGKTTTTAMLTWILDQMEQDPSFIIGGIVRGLRCNARAGSGPHFVIEADEYDNMFLGLSPTVAIITNIEYDHPDFFPTENDYDQAFVHFLHRTKPGGTALLCLDDPKTHTLYEQTTGVDFKVLGYGTSPAADYQAVDLITQDGLPQFTLRFKKPDGETEILGHVKLNVPGRHNVLNATAALAAIHQSSLSLPDAINALHSFTGTGRRFEVVGEEKGITIIDDYGHHPTEIGAALEAAHARYQGRRIWAIWQPHTYTRAQTLAESFVRVLDLADRVIVLKIYAAREKDPGYSAENIPQALGREKATYIPEFKDATAYLEQALEPGDVAIVFSAGDATQISQDLVENLRRDQSNKDTRFTKALLELKDFFGGQMHEKASMANFTTARVGGLVPALIEINTLDELINASTTLWQHELPFLVLGSGSNILVSDHGIDRIILLNRANAIQIDPMQDPPYVFAESGAILGTVARQTALNGLSGMEWAAPVPGTVGGAVYGNAGAHGSDMAKSVKMAKILHESKGVQEWTVEELAYHYRSSILKREHMPVVILSANFQVAKTSREEAWEKIKTYQAHRKRTQPPGASMGSMFRNPPGDYAGRLIEAVGLKGFRIGNAEISPIHANFIINLEGAAAQDIWQLMKMAQEKVFKEFGIELESEIELLGDFD